MLAVCSLPLAFQRNVEVGVIQNTCQWVEFGGTLQLFQALVGQSGVSLGAAIIIV